MVLERGGLGVDVVPAAGASWSVLAGPYEVRVLGTRFTTLWEPREQALSVRLERGSVRIVGTDIQEAVELRPGQRFDVQSGAKWSVTALEEEPREPADLPTALHPEDPQAPSTAPSAAPSAAKAEARPSTTQPSTTRPPPTRPPRRSLAHLVPEEHPGNPALRRADERAPEAGGARASSRAAIEGTSEGASRAGGHAPSHTASHTARWTELVNSGQSERVVELAEQRGVSACLESCSTEELRALADAARYTGRASEARAALLALRARGPVEASRAAYFLGSLAESRGQAAGALEWYTKSLGEAPDGPFSAEARAGRMRALLALGRRGEAREQAREYLRLHPSGVAAERAQQLSSSP